MSDLPTAVVKTSWSRGEEVSWCTGTRGIHPGMDSCSGSVVGPQLLYRSKGNLGSQLRVEVAGLQVATGTARVARDLGEVY